MQRHGSAVRCNTPIRIIILISFAAKAMGFREGTELAQIKRIPERKKERAVSVTRYAGQKENIVRHLC